VREMGARGASSTSVRSNAPADGDCTDGEIGGVTMQQRKRRIDAFYEALRGIHG